MKTEIYILMMLLHEKALSEIILCSTHSGPAIHKVVEIVGFYDKNQDTKFIKVKTEMENEVTAHYL